MTTQDMNLQPEDSNDNGRLDPADHRTAEETMGDEDQRAADTLKEPKEEILDQVAPTGLEKPYDGPRFFSTDTSDLRVVTDSSGKCIRVAWYTKDTDNTEQIVWEPARTWSRN